MQETRVQCLGQKDPLEKEMATHSSILAWRIPWTEEPGGLQYKWSKKSRMWLSDSTAAATITHTDVCKMYLLIVNEKSSLYFDNLVSVKQQKEKENYPNLEM